MIRVASHEASPRDTMQWRSQAPGSAAQEVDCGETCSSSRMGQAQANQPPIHTDTRGIVARHGYDPTLIGPSGYLISGDARTEEDGTQLTYWKRRQRVDDGVLRQAKYCIDLLSQSGPSDGHGTSDEVKQYLDIYVYRVISRTLKRSQCICTILYSGLMRRV